MTLKGAGAHCFIVISVFLSLACLANTASAGPYNPPGDAPPVALPLPQPVPPIGSKFTSNRILERQLTSTSFYEIDICRTGQGQWDVNPDPVFVGPTQFRMSQLHFRLCLNFVPPPGEFWKVWIVFGANPWPGAGAGASLVHMNQASGVFTLPLPDPLPRASYGFMLVLTDSSDTVVDGFDPLLITGTPSPSQRPPSCPIKVTRQPDCKAMKGE